MKTKTIILANAIDEKISKVTLSTYYAFKSIIIGQGYRHREQPIENLQWWSEITFIPRSVFGSKQCKKPMKRWIKVEKLTNQM